MKPPLVSNIGTRINLDLQQGADFSTTLSFVDASVPVNLDGATLAAQLRKRPLDPVVTATFALATDSPANGVVTISLDALESALISCANSPQDNLSRYYWDLWMTDSLGKKSCLFFGTVRVSPACTRP